jgi:hypothetical protein
MSTADTVFTSPNGAFTLSITDAGITLSGLGNSVVVDGAGVTIRGLIRLNDNGPAVARVGDPVTIPGESVLGVIQSGSLTVFAG